MQAASAEPMPPSQVPAPPPLIRATVTPAPRWQDQVPTRWHAPLLLIALAASAAFVRLCVQWQVPLPFCLLRTTTGIPCPGCGCTRSLLAWTHLDPIAALRFNPLFFVATLAVAAWAIRRTWVGLQTKAGRPDPTQSHAGSSNPDTCGDSQLLRRALSPRFLALLAALNWLYLCLTLPK